MRKLCLIFIMMIMLMSGCIKKEYPKEVYISQVMSSYLEVIDNKYTIRKLYILLADNEFSKLESSRKFDITDIYVSFNDSNYFVITKNGNIYKYQDDGIYITNAKVNYDYIANLINGFKFS